ncbi:PAS domain-containing protein [Methanomicrobium sp. W14]|uniref:hypothetical protein n=1 Tax=Methanomicrobium sp. W14 TaxID=2817839 RepID=UPI001AE6E97E|nr:hypothetical protein [Methanomicrobium sp. W14]MBP2132639.1 PAS domain-containing protein [Methanomicrobium sp. W14]
MGDYNKEFSNIIEILKENPRGMSVKQISEAIGVNRISVGHYLDIMLLSGSVDMESYGQAKVFYLSKRVPLFSLMDFTSDYVVILSDKFRIVRANKKFTDFMGLDEDITDEKNAKGLFGEFCPEIESLLAEASGGDEVVRDVSVCRNEKEHYFRMKILSAVFNDGTPGFTVIMEDITAYQESMEALKESEAQLKELIESIGEFLGDIKELEKINADIRNPLQAIVGLTDLEGGKNANLVYSQAVQIDNKLKEINIGWKEAENIREFLKKYAEIDDKN